jgi:4-hydroxy-tetrahydrodipicolinate reductase
MAVRHAGCYGMSMDARTSRPPIKIAIAGASGHMGRAVVKVVTANRAATLVGRLSRTDTREGLIAADAALGAADVVIDFTNGQASATLAEICAARGGPALVIGSTGFEAADLAKIAAAARHIAIVRSGNFSLGVNLLMGLVSEAAKLLPPERWDIEILEAHHRRKIDAPSGTALMLGDAAAAGRILTSPALSHARDSFSSERMAGEIGFAVLRGGGVVGEHTVMFVADGEILTLSHSALDRGMFARGAIAAALWVAARAAGEYDMRHVLGLPHAEGRAAS